MDNLSAVESIFFAALDRASAEERAAYLEKACGADAELRGNVERLLIAHPNVGNFLQTPARPDSVDETPISEGAEVRVGRYKLLQRIGEGGMGTVYLAQQQEPLRRLVALKLIKAGMDSAQILARFEQERQALALMDHPNVAKVLDAGATEQGRPYFVMELVHGVPITTYCDEHRLSLRERLELFVAVCLAVQHAHQTGVIHRDLKPSNVLVAQYDNKPVPKVIDFGVAKAQGQQLTERTLCTGVGAVIGTLEYMSPEQAQLNQLDIDTRSDVYSLGALLYELLTGSTPLDRQRLRQEALLEVLRLIREEEPLKPSERLKSSRDLRSLSEEWRKEFVKLVRRVRGDLDCIVMKALEKDRDRRYQTADGLAQDIERFLRDEPVGARPPSAAYRLRKFVKRNRGAMLAGVLVFLTLVAGVIGTMMGLKRAWDVEDAAKAIEARDGRMRNVQHAYQLTQALLAWERDDVEGMKGWLDEVEEAFQQTWEQRYLRALCHRMAMKQVKEKNWDKEKKKSLDKDPAPKRMETVAPKRMETVVMDAHGAAKAAFSPDSKWIVTGAQYNFVKVWDARTGDGRVSFQPTESVQADVRCLAWTPDSKCIKAAFLDKKVRTWDVSKPDSKPTFEFAIGTVGSGPVEWVDPTTGRRTIGRGVRPGDVWDEVAMAISTDGQRLASMKSSGTILVWNTATGSTEFDFQSGARSPNLATVAFSPRGQFIVTGTRDGTVTIWDAATGERKRALAGYFLAFTPDDQSVAIRACDAVAGPSGKLIPKGSEDSSVTVWDIATGERRFSIKVRSFPLSIAFSPDGQRIVTGNGDGTITLWDPVTLQEKLTLKAHPHPVTSVMFSPDGQRIASLGKPDCMVKVWEAPLDNPNPPATQEGQTDRRDRDRRGS
jgi:WD40 repeat protein